MDRVADFYGAYIDAILDRSAELGEQLRAHYLTEDLQRKLSEWEDLYSNDGVLRTPDIPIEWEVRYQESGIGVVLTAITLTWEYGDGFGYTRLTVQSDVGTNFISDIQDVE